MKKTNGYDEGHFYKYTLLTPFDGEGCDQLNLLLRKLLRNSFSTFVSNGGQGATSGIKKQVV